MRVRLSRLAESDLEEVWNYLSIEAPMGAADRAIEGIKAACERLMAFPASGSPRDDLAAGLRAAFHASFVIYYVVRDETVLVTRVVHGSREASALAGMTAFT